MQMEVIEENRCTLKVGTNYQLKSVQMLLKLNFLHVDCSVGVTRPRVQQGVPGEDPRDRGKF